MTALAAGAGVILGAQFGPGLAARHQHRGSRNGPPNQNPNWGFLSCQRPRARNHGGRGQRVDGWLSLHEVVPMADALADRGAHDSGDVPAARQFGAPLWARQRIND
jgi:hypothetical protein